MPAENNKSELPDDNRQDDQGLTSEIMKEWERFDIGRRRFFKQTTLAAGALLAASLIDKNLDAQSGNHSDVQVPPENLENSVTVSMRINGMKKTVTLDFSYILARYTARTVEFNRNLDIPEIEVFFIGKPDPHISPIGARGNWRQASGRTKPAFHQQLPCMRRIAHGRILF